MAVVYIEENGQYSLDCSKAIWSTDRIHSYYQDSGHQYGYIGFLCDVDFVIENDKNILLVEYKNASISGAVNPNAFRPESDNKLDNVAKKFYDSLHWLYLNGKEKKLLSVGIDPGRKRSSLLKKEDYGKYDYIIGMDDSNIRDMKRILADAMELPAKMLRVKNSTASFFFMVVSHKYRLMDMGK